MNKKVLILRKSLDNTEIINIYVLSIKIIFLNIEKILMKIQAISFLNSKKKWI